MATTFASQNNFDGLPSQFLVSLKTLFGVLDESKRGYIRLSDIESRWNCERESGLPEGIIDALRNVSPPNGKLSFELFVSGLKLALLSSSGRNLGLPAVTHLSEIQDSEADIIHSESDHIQHHHVQSHSQDNQLQAQPHCSQAPVLSQSQTQPHSHHHRPHKLYQNHDDLHHHRGSVTKSNTYTATNSVKPTVAASQNNEGGHENVRSRNKLAIPNTAESEDGSVSNNCFETTAGPCNLARNVGNSNTKLVDSSYAGPIYRHTVSENPTSSARNNVTSVKYNNHDEIMSGKLSIQNQDNFSLPASDNVFLTSEEFSSRPRSVSHGSMHSHKMKKDNSPSQIVIAQNEHITLASRDRPLQQIHNFPNMMMSEQSVISTKIQHPTTAAVKPNNAMVKSTGMPILSNTGLENERPTQVQQMESNRPNHEKNKNYFSTVKNVPNTNVRMHGADRSSVASVSQIKGYERTDPFTDKLSRNIERRGRADRRHTLSSGVDNSMITRMKQLEQEKTVFVQGLEVVEQSRIWLTKQIKGVQDKQRNISRLTDTQKYSLDANQERLNLLETHIAELTLQLSRLTDNNSKALPDHMNLEVGNSPKKLPGSEDLNSYDSIIARLKSQNKQLTQEVTEKCDRIGQLEKEKSQLVRELFQKGANHTNPNPTYEFDDMTFL